MTRVCILIGEGDSERYFLPSLLSHQMGFTGTSEKGPFLFQKGDNLYWFFPFPPQTGSVSSGRDRLKKTETYRIANTVIQNQSHLFYKPVEFHYRVLADHPFNDEVGQKNKIRDIEMIIDSSGVPAHGREVVIVENEMECWYFAGLDESFPLLDPTESRLFDSLAKLDPEKISDPKARLKKILLSEACGAIKIAELMGRHFNVGKAMESSRSFRVFIESLRNSGLL